MSNQLHQLDDARYISRLTKNTMALILAGGQGSRLGELTRWRAKPAVPFGGKFRIIDFALSNCVNSGVRQIGVLTQYKAHSLIRHLNRGWSRVNTDLGEFVEILPASQRSGGEWYLGTADAVYQNIDIIRSYSPEYVLVLGGDHIYKMDYGGMIASHLNTEADLTVCCIEVPIQEAANSYGVMSVDEQNQVRQFVEKPPTPDCIPGVPELALASMGNYLFKTEFLIEQLIADAEDDDSDRDFGKNILPKLIEDQDRYKVVAYPFRDRDGGRAYWRDVGTIDAYWKANVELTEVIPPLDIYDDSWPILTNQAQLPPAKFIFDEPDRRGMAIDSMVSGGCIVSGAILRRSLLFSDVRVDSHSTVTDCVVLPEVEIGEHCRINKAIIDRGAVIEAHTVIGENHDDDRRAGFHVTQEGVVLVTPDMLKQPLHWKA